MCAACGPGPIDACAFAVAGVMVEAAGAYDGLLRQAIVAMKHGERAYLDAFAPILAAIVPAGALLVPLPTTRRRRAARGFDQAVELAHRVARLRAGQVFDVLEKRGGVQRGRDRHARLRLDGRFRLRAGATLPLDVFLIDDVCTTGATLRDGIAALHAGGVCVSGAAVLARTAPNRNHRASTAVIMHGPRPPQGVSR